MTLPERHRHTSRRDKRLRCRAHLNWVKQFACVIPFCNNDGPIDPHHIHEGSLAGMSIKPPDDRCVSLCRQHHDECHAIGEEKFFEKYNPLVQEHRKNTIVGLIEEFNSASPALRKLRRPA